MYRMDKIIILDQGPWATYTCMERGVLQFFFYACAGLVALYIFTLLGRIRRGLILNSDGANTMVRAPDVSRRLFFVFSGLIILSASYAASQYSRTTLVFNAGTLVDCGCVRFRQVQTVVDFGNSTSRFTDRLWDSGGTPGIEVQMTGGPKIDIPLQGSNFIDGLWVVFPKEMQSYVKTLARKSRPTESEIRALMYSHRRNVPATTDMIER